MKRVLMVGALVLLGTAQAQDVLTGLPSLDPSRLGADVFSLGGLVLLLVQFIKRQVERVRPDGTQVKPAPWVWWGLSVALAELSAAGLFYARFGASVGDLAPPWGWLLFGLLAGLVASGFKDLVVGLLKMGSGTGAAAPAAGPAALPVPVVVGEIVPPGDVKEPPSGLESLTGAQGIMGNLGAVTLDALLGQVLEQAGLAPTPARLARIGARLVTVAPDLLDGSAYLSAQSRQVILGVVLDLKKEGGL